MRYLVRRGSKQIRINGMYWDASESVYKNEVNENHNRTVHLYAFIAGELTNDAGNSLIGGTHFVQWPLRNDWISQPLHITVLIVCSSKLTIANLCWIASRDFKLNSPRHLMTRASQSGCCSLTDESRSVGRRSLLYPKRSFLEDCDSCTHDHVQLTITLQCWNFCQILPPQPQSS